MFDEGRKVGKEEVTEKGKKKRYTKKTNVREKTHVLEEMLTPVSLKQALCPAENTIFLYAG